MMAVIFCGAAPRRTLAETYSNNHHHHVPLSLRRKKKVFMSFLLIVTYLNVGCMEVERKTLTQFLEICTDYMERVIKKTFTLF